MSVLGLQLDSQEQLCLVAQVSKYLSASRIAALKNELEKINATLPITMQVRKFYMTYDEIAAKTAIKVSRKYLQKAIEDGRVELLPFIKDTDNVQLTADSPIQKKVTEIIADILSVNPNEIGADAHILLDLGASSLQYFSILSALAAEFGISARDGDTYSYTVREISAYIERYI